MKLALWLMLVPLAVMVTDLSAAKARQVPGIQQDTKQMIYIAISGTHGARYSGTLTVHGNSESYSYSLEGSAPSQLEYPGEGVTLEVTLQSEGNLAIEVRKGSNRSTSRMDGAGSVMRLSVQ
ncbi:hypothetical protein ACM26W_11785 [Halomonas sp. HK25]|uniref:hypothetical protein n=1 Tax=Halomonas sp. HK25 TaxID=3394321 RepID=UPI0039FBCFCB